MDLSIYIGKFVQIILTNNFTYVGKVIEADNDSLVLIDKYRSKVSLSEKYIKLIKEKKSVP